MLRIRAPHAALGLGQVPYQAQIQELVRSFPKCFKSRQVLPYIDQAQQLARSIDTSTLSRYSGSYTPEAAKSALERRWWALDYWRKRLSSEPETQYCVGTTGGKKSTDREQILNAITGVYIDASGVAGAQEVVNQAVAQLKSDTFGVVDLQNLAPWYLNPKYLAPIAIALVGFAAYQRIRGPKQVQAEA